MALATTAQQRLVQGARRCEAAPARAGARARPLSLRCAAAGGSNNGNNNDVDWDAAWRNFRKEMNSMVDTQPRPSTYTRPPRTARDQVKRDERLLVDFWVKSSTYQFGGLLFTAAFLLVIFATGPAPADPRCTLPWC